MHVSSYDNLRRCVKRFVFGDTALAAAAPLRVLEVTTADTDGAIRSLFRDHECEHTVEIVTKGDEVGTADGSATLPFGDRSFDVIVCCHTLGSVPSAWALFAELERALADHGVLVVVDPSSDAPGPAPDGCYRILPGGIDALAAGADLTVVDRWIDPRGPFHDLVAVLRRTPGVPNGLDHSIYLPEVDGGLQNDQPPGPELPEHELRAGSQLTIPFLRRIHKVLEPRYYLEVGVFDGQSLRQAKCPAVGIDPAPASEFELRPGQWIHTGLSADFFADPACTSRLGPVDLAYVDGMHLVENAYEDFMHVEAHAHPCAVLLVDDVYPNHPTQARRQRSSRHWTGDVWKFVEILRRTRPDLILLPIDTAPTGTLVVLGVDPGNDTLREAFDVLLESAIGDPSEPPPWVLERTDALDPGDPLLWRALRAVRDLRDAEDPEAGIARLRGLVAGALPRKVTGTR